MGRLEGRSVVVTGAASGIGEATARGVIREGGRVVIADLQEERAAALAAELGAGAVFHKTDVRIEDDIRTRGRALCRNPSISASPRPPRSGSARCCASSCRAAPC